MKRTPMRNTKSAPLNPKVPPSARVNDIKRSSVFDSLENLVTGLGGSKDKLVGTSYVFNEINKLQLEYAFRSDWIARKVCCIPAQDATREWRYWDIEPKDRDLLETAEKLLGVQQKIKSAMIKARLYGGAGLLMGINDGSLDKPLDVKKVGKDSLRFLHVVSKWDLSAGPMVWDLESPLYGMPEYYMRAGGASAQKIHPTYVVRFVGNEVPDITMSQGWGDSILQSVSDAIKAAGMTAANVAQLMNEMKMDVVRVPGLTDGMANAQYANRLTERFGLANVAKSLYNLLLLDKEEEWERITANLSGVDDVLKMYLLIASAAADIPATRMLSQSPAGLSATGESDIRNYYDNVRSEQSTTLQPALSPLDEVLIRSTLGTAKPEESTYRWMPLWQMDEKDKAEVSAKKAASFKIDVDTALIPSEILRDARLNQLIEDGVYPGLTEILEEYGPLDPIDGTTDPTTGAEKQAPPDPNAPVDPNAPPADPNAPVAAPVQSAQTITSDMAKRIRRANMRNNKYRNVDGVNRTLYVYRPVLNTGDLLRWAKGLDIPSLEASNELHTTIMYSRTPVDWSKTGEAWGQDEKGNLTVKPGGMRAMQLFGNALVLCFNSSELGWRHCQIKESTGATWDYAEYQPHITLAYLDPADARDFDERTLTQMGGYGGVIEFGPEVFAEASNPYVRDSNGNPYFDGGPGSGPQGGGGAKEKIANFVASGKDVLGSVVEKLKDPENRVQLVAGAIQFGLYHVIGADYGPDIEKAIHGEVHAFAANAKVSLGMAKETMSKACTALIGMRQAQLAGRNKDAMMADAEDKILAALKQLKEAIDNMPVPADDPKGEGEK